MVAAEGNTLDGPPVNRLRAIFGEDGGKAYDEMWEAVSSTDSHNMWRKRLKVYRRNMR